MIGIDELTRPELDHVCAVLPLDLLNRAISATEITPDQEWTDEEFRLYLRYLIGTPELDQALMKIEAGRRTT